MPGVAPAGARARGAAHHVVGLAAVAAAWAAGHGVHALIGFPAPIAGLLILASALLLRPEALAQVGPTADIAVRWLPLLFVPIAVAGASVMSDADVGALAAAVLVSVPAGFVVTAPLLRR